MPPTLFNKLEVVKDKTSLIVFIQALAVERAEVESIPVTADGFQGEWANNTITGFLEAALAWAKDSEFGMYPDPKPTNTWQLIAQLLWAGRSYE